MSELKRWYQYVEGEPAMCLAPKVDRQRRTAYVICLSAAWKYREPDYLSAVCGVLMAEFDLGFSEERLRRMGDFIQDGLDDLVRMKPECAVYDDKPKVVGEGELFVDGSKQTSFEVTDRGMK